MLNSSWRLYSLYNNYHLKLETLLPEYAGIPACLLLQKRKEICIFVEKEVPLHVDIHKEKNYYEHITNQRKPAPTR